MFYRGNRDSRNAPGFVGVRQRARDRVHALRDTLASPRRNGRDRSAKKTRVCRMRAEKMAWIIFATGRDQGRPDLEFKPPFGWKIQFPSFLSFFHFNQDIRRWDYRSSEQGYFDGHLEFSKYLSRNNQRRVAIRSSINYVFDDALVSFPIDSIMCNFSSR